MPSTRDAQPRKAVVGTSMYAMWGAYPGLAPRLKALVGLVDRMASEARRKHKARLDLAVLPENAVTACARGGTAAERSVPLEGEVLDVMGACAQRNGAYVVVPLGLEEGARKKVYSNAAAILDRKGRVAGIYRKVHLVDEPDTGVMEGGREGGKNFPVFDLDFGRIGIQICYDVFFDDGWEVLARKGAEIIAWPTMSPQTIRPRCLARRWGYYIVSSTPRNNASIFDPAGNIIAQVIAKDDAATKECKAQRGDGTEFTDCGVVVEQIDLTWLRLNWQAELRNGLAFAEKYGRRVGYRYSEAEDSGIFWSNDPRTPVRRMVRELGLPLSEDQLRRSQRLQDAARGGPVSLK